MGTDPRPSDSPDQKGKLAQLGWFINKVGFPIAMVVALSAWIWYREGKSDENMKLISEMNEQLRSLNKTADSMNDRLERIEFGRTPYETKRP